MVVIRLVNKKEKDSGFLKCMLKSKRVKCF